MHDEANRCNVVGYATFVKVWLVLVVLTLLLVGVSATLGGGAAVLTMLLVTPAKASLVGYFFMDLRHEGGAIRNMVFVALGTLVVFIGLLFSDFLNR
jgi:cytochrome c oxidase subunit IV